MCRWAKSRLRELLNGYEFTNVKARITGVDKLTGDCQVSQMISTAEQKSVCACFVACPTPLLRVVSHRTSLSQINIRKGKKIHGYEFDITLKLSCYVSRNHIGSEEKLRIFCTRCRTNLNTDGMVKSPTVKATSSSRARARFAGHASQRMWTMRSMR